MKLDFAQNWQNGTKYRPYGPPGAAETKIFGLMGVQPPIQSCPEKIFEFSIFIDTTGTLILAQFFLDTFYFLISEHCVKVAFQASDINNSLSLGPKMAKKQATALINVVKTKPSKKTKENNKFTKNF